MNTIEFEKLSPYTARFGNFFYQFEKICSFDFFSKKIHIRPLVNKEKELCSFILRLKIEENEWKIAFKSDDILLFNPAIKSSKIIQENYKDFFPLEVRQALLETLFLPYIEEIAKKIGMNISIISVDYYNKDIDFSSYLAFLFEEENYTNIFYVQIPENQQSLVILNIVEQIFHREENVSNNFSDILFDLSFCIGKIELNVLSLQELECGDCILFDEYFLNHNKIRLYPSCYAQQNQKGELLFGSGSYIECSVKNSNEICVLDWIHTKQENIFIQKQEDKGNNMEENNENEIQESEKSLVDLNEIVVSINFSLDERVFTLQELQNIKAGYVFTLNSDVISPVSLLVNGKSIGKGKIVDINGTMGVQVIEIKR